MRTRSSICVVFLLALTASASRGQTPDNSKPAPTNVRNAEYPRVSADGRVTFRVYAPDARKVQIDPRMNLTENNGYNGLGKAVYDMTRDRDGYWTVTTPPAVAGLHYYYVLIDGVAVVDPSGHAYYANNRETSAVEVLKPGIDFYLPKDVPHGQVRLFWHYSKLTGQWRRAYVYLPPGYDSHPGQRYPVLYLRHGGGDDESGWVEQGHVNFILDNLIAEGKAKPMIAVMEWGYADIPGRPAEPPGFSPLRPGTDTPEVAEVTAKETIPAIDADFRTISDRNHRAIAGFSLGCRQTLYIGLTNLDKFSALGVFSRPPVDNFDLRTLYGGVMADAASFNKKVHLFWWGTGTGEDGIYKSVQATRANLEKAGIRYSYKEFPGLAHEWPLQREEFRDFATKVFQ
jgi:enterochelin esterase-like enzyme